MEFHYVYQLISEVDSRRHYTGITSDLKGRLDRRNSGAVVHTAKWVPWRIEVAVAFGEKEKAQAFEKYLKTGSGRAFSKRHF
jgi:putative endonuclease